MADELLQDLTSAADRLTFTPMSTTSSAAVALVTGSLLDKPTIHNMSLNSTIPWQDQEAMGQLVQQWMTLKNLPPMSAIAAFVGFVVMHTIIILIRYPLWQVVATMAIVEAPQTVFRNDRRPSLDKKHDDYDSNASNAIASQQRPVSASLRSALRHIYRISGFPSFYRAMAVHACGVVAVFIINFIIFIPLMWKVINVDANINAGGFTSKITALLPVLACTLLLCQWDAVHTHILITPATLRIWYRRLPPFMKTLKSTWLPLLVQLLAHEITFNLPYFFRRKAGLYNTGAYLGPLATGSALFLRRSVFVLIWLAAQAARLELLVPAGVAIVRVQTSLLPNDEDTIVPVDRTFGTGGSHNGETPRAGGRSHVVRHFV